MSHSDRPRWSRSAWFLGEPPPLTARQWRVLGLVSAVSFFEQYDLYLFALNLKQIQQSLAIPEGDLGWLGSFVRAGALLSFVVGIVADRVGRRRALLGTVAAYTLLTAATALAPDAQTFVLLQFLARTFAVAEVLLATVVIIEEFPAEHRGWGVGAMYAIQACGAGTAALLFGFVDVLPWGWRSLYALGLLPIFLLARWRRVLPETQRFAAAGAHRMRDDARGLARLVGECGGRLASVSACAFLFAFGLAGVGFFQVKYMQDVQGWSVGAISLLTVAGGALAIVANPVAGRWADRHGRRHVMALFLCASAAGAAAFYTVTGPAVAVLWIVYLFAQFGADTVLSTYAGEVFPTALRSTASSFRVVMATVGSVVGLSAVSWLYPVLGSNWRALVWLPVACIAAGLVALWTFRETAGQTLEEINAEA